MTIRHIWQRIKSTRYTRALETENARLRDENRALLNSILGIAGVPPIPVAEHLQETYAATRAPSAGSAGPAATPSHAAATRHATKSISDMKPAAPNTRRRSWHQINRMLELESQRKPVASD